MIYFIIAATFFSVSFTCIALYFWLYQRFFSSSYKIGNRLKELGKANIINSSETTLVLRDTQLSQIPLFNRLLEKLSISKNLQKLLEHADIPLKVGQLIILMVVLFMIGVLVGVQSQQPVLGLLIGGALGFFPLFLVIMRVSRRLKAFSHEFPDAIDMLTGALRAGHAFSKGLQLVAIEAPDPLGSEFRKTFEEHNLGMPIKESLINLTNRVNNQDLKLFVAAVLLQRETGGNLTEILEKISYTIRERFKLMGQIQVFTAQGRLSAWILGMMPICFMLLIGSINPEYLQPLFTERIGHYMLLVSATLQILGFIIIRKIVRLKLN